MGSKQKEFLFPISTCTTVLEVGAALFQDPFHPLTYFVFCLLILFTVSPNKTAVFIQLCSLFPGP